MKRFIFFVTAFVFLIGGVQAYGAEAKTKKQKTSVTKGPKDAKPSDTHYHALIIGNNQYKHLPKLKTARNDAVEVEKLLKEKLGFQTEILLDATRAGILDRINDLRKRLSGKDSLLIYYAGHGEYDKTVEKSYWLPVDAQGDNPTNWIMADDITSNIKRIAARHVLIVSDSCYSGTLGRQAITELISSGGRDGYLRKMQERPSRTLMASGGNEPVSDSGGGNNSVFAAAFLKALKESDKTQFTAEEIFHTRIKEIVAGKSDQVPEYSNIKNSGHEGGDFVFRLARMEAEPLKTASDIKIQRQEEDKQYDEERKKIEKERRRLEAEKAQLEKDRKRIEQEQKLEEERQKLAEEQKRLEEEKEALAAQKKKKVKKEKKTEETVAMAPRPSAPSSVSSFTDSGTGIEMVLVKGGCYQMGDTFGDGEGDEKPVHEACVDDFYLGKFEVTQGQWKAVMGNNPSYFKSGDNYPVETVSWNDAQDFIRKLNERTGKRYRLPTEAEWEYAARSGGKAYKYSWGNGQPSGNIADESAKRKNSSWTIWEGYDDGYPETAPVGRFNPNELGLYDMTGNVWEWCQDTYNSSAYQQHSRNNPIYTGSGSARVIRGGSWHDKPRFVRAANRDNYTPGLRGYDLGFRLAGPK